MLYCRANQLKSMMEKKMKSLKPTKFLAFLTLVAFSSYSVASESVEVKLTYSPGQQAEYQNKSTGSVTMTGKQGASGSSNSRYRITATEVDKDGNLPITVKILSSESIVRGKKKQASRLPKAKTVKQSPSGQFITKNKSDKSLVYYLAPLYGFEFPEEIVIGKKYPINFSNEALNQYFASKNRKIDLTDYDVQSWVKVHKANEQLAWGEIDLTFKVSGKNKKESISVSGTRQVQFKYNRHTHLFEEVHDKIQYSMLLSKGIKVKYVTDSTIELIKKK